MLGGSCGSLVSAEDLIHIETVGVPVGLNDHVVDNLYKSAGKFGSTAKIVLIGSRWKRWKEERNG